MSYRTRSTARVFASTHTVAGAPGTDTVTVHASLLPSVGESTVDRSRTATVIERGLTIMTELVRSFFDQTFGRAVVDADFKSTEAHFAEVRVE